MKALCSHTDAVSQCGFWGGVESGWAEVGERWEWVASQFVPGQGEVTSETAFLTVSGDMAYGVFIERWWGQFKSRPEPSRADDPSDPDLPARGRRLESRPRHGDNAVERLAKLTPCGAIHRVPGRSVLRSSENCVHAKFGNLLQRGLFRRTLGRRTR